MAYFYRVGAYLLFALSLLGLVVPVSRAQTSGGGIAPVAGTLYGAQSFVTGNYFPATQSSIAAACAVAAGQVANGYGVNGVVASGQTCVFSYNGGSWAGGVTSIAGSVCPVGSTLSGASCACNLPLVVNSSFSACVSPPPPVVPIASSDGKPYYFDARCAALCYKGVCSAAAGCPTAVTGPTGPAIAIPNTCSGGSTPGEVNGIFTCAKPDFTSFGKSSSSGTSAKDASGTVAAPSPGSVPDAVTSETTSCTDALCKTTSTSTTPVTAGGGGGIATTQVKVESKDDYCTRNPRSPGCTTDSSFGGACGSFNGTGDALAVATARAVSDSKCALETLKGTEGYGAPALAAAGVDRPSDSPVNNKQLVDLASMINKGNPFGESCVPDYPINVPKVGQIVIPLTAYCSVLAYLGKLLVGMSLLVGASIVAKRDA